MSVLFTYCYITHNPNLVLTDSEHQEFRLGAVGMACVCSSMSGASQLGGVSGVTEMTGVGSFFIHMAGFWAKIINHLSGTVNQNTYMAFPCGFDTSQLMSVY